MQVSTRAPRCALHAPRSPFVVHLKPAMAELAKEYQSKGVRVLAISSNSAETHPQVGVT